MIVIICSLIYTEASSERASEQAESGMAVPTGSLQTGKVSSVSLLCPGVQWDPEDVGVPMSQVQAGNRLHSNWINWRKVNEDLFPEVWGN